MNERELPIVDGSGRILPGAAEIIWGLMHYPNDLSTVMTFHNLARTHRNDLQKDPDCKPPRLLDLSLHDMERRNGRARVAGLVLQTALRVAETDASGRLRKSYAFAAKVLGDAPSSGKKRAEFPSDERAIRRAYSDFRQVSHLWLAYMVSAATPDPNLFEGELGLICFLEKSQSFLKEARLADIEKIDGLWTAPAVLEIPGNGCFKYLETEELESFLSSYCILEDRPTE